MLDCWMSCFLFVQLFDKYFGTPPAEERIGDKKSKKEDSCCGSSCCPMPSTLDPSVSALASRDPAPDTDAYFSTTNKIALDDDMDFDALVASEHPTCVKFTASWCKPCQQQEPELKQLAEDMAVAGSKIRFVVVDVDKHDELFAKLEIIGIPHIRIYQRSQVLHTFAGRPTEMLKQACMELSTTE